MRAVTFELSGETAFFKKPDVNTYAYFTYSQIHKVALLGLLGSIIGLKGYSQQEGETYPKFYEVLKDLKVAICPTSAGDLKGVCSKKLQVFNNSVGYASQEEGGNLIVKEQWLEHPSWQIYILENKQPYYEELKRYLLESRCKYIPYLGKNDHFANISHVKEITVEKAQHITQIHSLYPAEAVIYEEEEYDWEGTVYYKYQEKLPIGLEPYCNQYEVTTFVMSNRIIKQVNMREGDVLGKYQEEILYFF